jgi:PAS domain S-box-containing protein
VEEGAGGRGYEAAPMLAPYQGHIAPAAGAQGAADAAGAQGGAPAGGAAGAGPAGGAMGAGPAGGAMGAGPAGGAPSAGPAEPASAAAVPAANGGGPAPAAPAEVADPRRPLFGKKRDTGPAREKRAGFDDAKEPMATIELDGHFRELNQAFSDLVGYTEDDFKSASWPPVMDRANLEKHREQMKQLLAGEVESAEVNTGYVHAQGLLVPVVGTISLVKAGDEPDHFLLAAKS